jgi:hypothetical protein
MLGAALLALRSRFAMSGNPEASEAGTRRHAAMWATRLVAARIVAGARLALTGTRATASHGGISAVSRPPVRRRNGRLPLAFQANREQTDRGAGFGARGLGYGV